MMTGGVLTCAMAMLLIVKSAYAETPILDMVHGCEVLDNPTDQTTLKDLELANQCLGAVQDVVEENENSLICLPKVMSYKTVIHEALPLLKQEVRLYGSKRSHFHDVVAITISQLFPCRHSNAVIELDGAGQ